MTCGKCPWKRKETKKEVKWKRYLEIRQVCKGNIVNLRVADYEQECRSRRAFRVLRDELRSTNTKINEVNYWIDSWGVNLYEDYLSQGMDAIEILHKIRGILAK